MDDGCQDLSQHEGGLMTQTHNGHKSKERMRKCRMRKQMALKCISLEIRDGEIQAMMAKGIIPQQPTMQDIRSGLYLVLDQYFRR
jgi:hypothetical protein